MNCCLLDVCARCRPPAQAALIGGVAPRRFTVSAWRGVAWVPMFCCTLDLSFPAESRPEVAANAKPARAASDGSGAAYRAEDVSYHPPVAYPPHERNVEVRVGLIEL